LFLLILIKSSKRKGEKMIAIRSAFRYILGFMISALCLTSVGGNLLDHSNAPLLTNSMFAQAASLPATNGIYSPLPSLYLPLTFKNFSAIDGGKIAFVSERNGNPEIYSMNYDGSNVTRLTNNPTTDQNPDWSPDGSMIAFESDRTGTYEIYTMNADGSLQTQITKLGHCYGPQWSPNGSRIVFHTSQNFQPNTLYTMNPDGSDLIPIYTTMDYPDQPSWSPDGTEIAFVSSDPTPGIYVIHPDGSDESLLLAVYYLSYYAWSPDGSELVLAKAHPPQLNSDLDLYVIDTGITTRITETNVNHNSVNWSPTGRHLIFASQMTFPGNFDIYTITPDGGNLIDLTNNPAPDSEPDWTR